MSGAETTELKVIHTELDVSRDMAARALEAVSRPNPDYMRCLVYASLAQSLHKSVADKVADILKNKEQR